MRLPRLTNQAEALQVARVLVNEAKIIVKPSSPAKQLTCALIAILGTSAVVFFFGLGRLGFLGPDEPRYAEVAREMFASGDYISTRLCGCLWFEKPALIYWMAAAGYHLFGVNELAARIPTAVAALATVALVYFGLRRLGLTDLGLAASLVLATSGIFIAYARVATPDMALTATTTAALLAAFSALRSSGRAQTWLWSLAFALVGLAVLAKGLVGIVLVVAILGFHLVLTRELRSIRLTDLLIGSVVFGAVAGAWYIPVTVRHGWPFIEEFFIRHHFERYVSNEFGHPQPAYFFFVVALAGMVPWTFFLIPAVARLKSLRPREDLRGSLLALAWLWVAVTLVFFSFSESKLPGYILPSFPALAIIIGAEIEAVWRDEQNLAQRIAVLMTGLTILIAAIAFVVYLHRESVELSGLGAALQWLPLVVAFVSLAAIMAGHKRILLAATGGAVISLVIASVILLFPALQDEVSLKAFSLQAAGALRPDEKIGFYLKKEFAPVFYSSGRVLCDSRRGQPLYALNQDMLADALENQPSMIVITDLRWVEALEGDPRFEIEYIGTQNDSTALRVALRR